SSRRCICCRWRWPTPSASASMGRNNSLQSHREHREDKNHLFLLCVLCDSVVELFPEVARWNDPPSRFALAEHHGVFVRSWLAVTAKVKDVGDRFDPVLLARPQVDLLGLEPDVAAIPLGEARKLCGTVAFAGVGMEGGVGPRPVLAQEGVVIVPRRFPGARAG